MTPSQDPRVALLQRNQVGFLRAMTSQRFAFRAEPDVFWYTSDLFYPMFNGAFGPKFAAGEVASRTHQVLDELMANGKPFLWHTDPGNDDQDMIEVLLGRGLEPLDASAGMHLSLADHAQGEEALPPGVTVQRIADASAGSSDGTPHRADAATGVIAQVFGIPPEFTTLTCEMMFAPQPDTGAALLGVLASQDGSPVGAGTLAITDGTAGLYNIAVLEQARGQGIGRAVTTELLRLASEHDCRDAVLTSSEMGHPLYQRLGFVDLCRTRNYLWMPPY